MTKITSLQSLLEQASKSFSVPLPLLENILDIERKRLYLFDSPRTSVLDDILHMIQEETQKRS
ncbi:MAG: hypothetical protein ABSD92_01370 [Candidatus Bathyarchaeia archaeon]|jgi:hypothetical protein